MNKNTFINFQNKILPTLKDQGDVWALYEVIVLLSKEDIDEIL